MIFEKVMKNNDLKKKNGDQGSSKHQTETSEPLQEKSLNIWNKNYGKNNWNFYKNSRLRKSERGNFK